MANILLLTHEFPPFRGGIGTYACQMASAAHRLGHVVTVAAPDYRSDRCVEDRIQHPFRVIRFRGGAYSDRSLPSLILSDCRILRGGDYDVIHAVDWPHLLAMGMLNKVGRTPFLATVYGTEILGSARSRLTCLLGARRLFEVPDRILAISEFTRGLLGKHFPEVESRRIDVTLLGVSPFWLADSGDGVALRSKYGIPRRNRVVLTASRLDPRKGHRLALQSLALLPERLREGLSYVIVGEGGGPGYLRELRALADDSGLQVIFTGGVDDVVLREFYRTSSVFCMPGEPHPKKVEGFGLVFLEAAGQGLPSVTSDVGAVAEVVRHGETGLVVPPMDAAALARALARLLDDEPLRSTLACNARAQARAFTWERCAEATYGPAEAASGFQHREPKAASARHLREGVA